MKAWLNSVRGKRGLALTGMIAALIGGAVSWGQASPQEMEEPGEVPMVAPPLSPQSPVPPNLPFTPPSPTPLPPEQAAPFVPAMPFSGANPLEPPVPQIRLRIQAPAHVEADKEIEYRLTVENVSAAPAHHVLVRDRLPQGVEQKVRAEPAFTQQPKTKAGETDLLWELGTLKPGEQKVIVLAVKPKGNEDVENRAYVQFEHGQKVATRIAKPSVSVKVTAPPQVIRYEAIDFHIDVANTGDAPLRNIVVNDELPESLEFVSAKPEPNAEKPLTWKIGEIPPHQTRRIEYQAIAKQIGTFHNNAKATSAGASAADKAAVTVGESKLKISISGPQRRLVNRPIPYHITVGNVGTVPLTNVQVSDELPPGVEFQSAVGGGRREGGFVRWSLGSLKPSEVRSLLLVLHSPKPGWCFNEAKAQADHEMSERVRSEGTHIDRIAGTPVIEIDKSTDSLIVGQKATYTIRLFNPGKSTMLHPSVFVEVPEGMSIRGQRGPTTGQQQGQRIRFAPLPAIDAGREESYVVEVEARKAGEAKLRAWWTDGRQESSAPETWEDKTIILDPSKLTDNVGFRPLNLHASYLLRMQTQPRLRRWTWAVSSETIP
jgi:uncharacterized repeat protein (TIGR01451 family)